MKLAVITGAGTGIGRELALSLVAEKMSVIAIGRRLEPLKSLQAKAPDLIQIISADVSNPDDRQKIAEHIPKDTPINYLIHNAAVLTPVVPLTHVTLDEWRQTMAINVEAPLFLTQILLPQLTNARVLYISSEWAHTPAYGFGAYCTSKAALYMLYKQSKEELTSKNIFFGSVNPGIVETPMQEYIRKVENDRLPEKDFFKNLHHDNLTIPTATCAAFLKWILLQTSTEKFCAEKWDIYNRAHHHEWLGERFLPIPGFI